ncbi:Fis family transcriptional regulator, partial [Candidatus Endoriftia persephone str. Guaymas]|nr:Fis family transcriptional regulator [Candidatus Endoriftia persephone str. Guaymas]
KVIIDRAYQLYELEAENRAFSAQQRMTPLDGVIASSTEMISVCRVIERVSPTDATVLLLGESGTGKEVLAKAVHDLSDRSENKFVAINCASIP